MRILYLGEDSVFFDKVQESINKSYPENITAFQTADIFSNEDELVALAKKYSATHILVDYELVKSVIHFVVKIVCKVRTNVSFQVSFVGSERDYEDIEDNYFSSSLMFSMKNIDVCGLIFSILSLSSYQDIVIPSYVRAVYKERLRAKIPMVVDHFTPHSITLKGDVNFGEKEICPVEFIDDAHKLKSGYYSILKHSYVGAGSFAYTSKVAIRSSIQSSGSNGANFVTNLKYEARHWSIGPKTLSKIRDVSVSAGERGKYGQDTIPRLLQLLQYNWVLKEGASAAILNKLTFFMYDEKSTFLYSEVEGDKLDPYIFNSFENMILEIQKWKPNIICFERSSDYSTMVVEVVRTISEIVDYFPYIVLFKSDYNSETIRDIAEYHQIISFPFTFRLEVLENVVSIYLEKNTSKISARGEKRLKRFSRKYPEPSLDQKHFDELTIIPDQDVIAFAKSEIELLGISEVEVFFRSSIPLVIGSKLILKLPFDLNVQVVPHVEKSKMSKDPRCFRGVVTLIKEEDLQLLRQYVNSVARVEQLLANKK